ncbi:metalloprotease, putative [Plasmodium ovale wallikeri]|uniref:Metalloprotease, putative n=2 Tax=Plasmodium ovale TaxID=36330 RepID=A0A1A8ZHW1_PLAOA|nr:metalloprotease, putative [Plasmodium ovale wallikeri]SBT43934.1 metalloprotease, putative [Plasmodium ovale wallikeri]SBT78517.1 metalloprotease, putative [Plasmodium ovale]
MDEARKIWDNIRENIKSVRQRVKQYDLKKKVENLFLSNTKEKEKIDDMLSLIQYSLRYKNVCKWPNRNDLFVINYNINDNFKSIAQKHEDFFKQYKSFSPSEERKNSTMKNNREKEYTKVEMIDHNINVSLSDRGKTSEKISKEALNNRNNSNGNIIHLNDNNITRYSAGEGKEKNTQWDKIQQKEKGKKMNTHFNDDISLYNKIKLQIFMYFVRNNYRIKILVDSLSALNRPINIIYINCPNNKEKKKSFIEKIGNIFSPNYKVNDHYINNKDIYQKNSKDSCSCSELSSLDQYKNSNTSYTQKKKKKSNYAGGYNPISNTIWLCSNNITSFYKLKYILTHELVHAFDFARANIDMYNCHHIACSEIRAYNMSNQCSYFNSKYFLPDHDVFNYFKSPSISDTAKNKCIYNNVYSSLHQYKPCENNAHIFINNVFEKCLHDYWPFMCAPEQDSKYKPSKILRKDN